MTDAPSSGEVLRRLDDVARANERTVLRLDELTRTLSDLYIPRREYDLRVGELEKDAATQAAFRRQVAAGFLVGALIMVLTIALSLVGIGGTP